ncbi:MAG: type II toxin-antitoxin system HicB family antitoxin [Solirubrobacterales bacterium]|nr:type II toxin-antitoxin system HicB family antitoxin [Thermoleophilales bacterium]MCO5328385.1 type II toxin-antitoxin system HicB family antitoxin [Solirubrobacterales bacterium]
MTEYVAIYEQAEDGGWGAYLPDLPEVVGLGATRVEVEERLAEALAVYAEFMAEEERPLPQPASYSGTVTL